MSNRRDPYFLQLVSEQDAGTWIDDLEVADHAQFIDLGFSGIMSGLVASQHGGGNYTVDVTGGIAYDQLGQRIYVPSTQNVDLSVDHLSASINVTTTGHSKVISLFVKFDRALQNPKTDGHGSTIYYDRLESYGWFVKQGSEATTGTETPPSKEADGLLVANITLAYSASPQAILTAAISTTTRDDLVVVSGSPVSLRRGSYLAALGDLVAQLNAISGGSFPVPASAVTYAGGGSWAGGTSPTNPSTSVEAQLDKIIADLSATTSGASGADRMGVAQLTGVSSNIVAGTLFAALSALKTAQKIDMPAGGTWADSTTVSAAALSTWGAGIVNTLGTYLGSASASGAHKIGYYSTYGIPATNVQGALDAFGSTTASADGAVIVGAEVKGSFVSNTVRGQLDDLDTTRGKIASANHWTGANTFDSLAMTAGHSYGLSSRSVTRVLGMTSPVGPTSIGTGSNQTFSFALPHGVVLTSIAANVVPTNHGAWPPTGRPAFILARWPKTTGTPTTVASNNSVDPASNLSQGNANRQWTMGSLTETVDRTATSIYTLTIDNESGTNSTSTLIASIEVTCTVTGLDDLPVD